MAGIRLINGLIFTDLALRHGNKEIVIKNALVDTGSAATVISSEIALGLGLRPEAEDKINSVQGIGGSENVYEKRINAVSLDVATITDFYIQVGAMAYGIELDGIIGLDLLTECKAILDLSEFILKTSW